MNQINIAELLKDCPKGTKLWSPLFGICALKKVESDNPYDPNSNPILTINEKSRNHAYFDAFGNYYDDIYRDETAEIMLYPSKDHRTWEDWGEYKVNCLPKPKRPDSYGEACEILGIPYDEDAHPWVKLNVLGKAWNKVDGVTLKESSGYCPIVYPVGPVEYFFSKAGIKGYPALFASVNTALAFGQEFEDLYLRLRVNE